MPLTEASALARRAATSWIENVDGTGDEGSPMRSHVSEAGESITKLTGRLDIAMQLKTIVWRDSHCFSYLKVTQQQKTNSAAA